MAMKEYAVTLDEISAIPIPKIFQHMKMMSDRLKELEELEQQPKRCSLFKKKKSKVVPL